MERIELRSVNSDGVETVVRIPRMEGLPELMQYIEQFLRGSGYHFGGKLIIVDEDLDE